MPPRTHRAQRRHWYPRSCVKEERTIPYRQHAVNIEQPRGACESADRDNREIIGISTVRLILIHQHSRFDQNSPNPRMLHVASDVMATTS